MALQVWLPLDGTLENKGCDDATIENNGATVETDGKIGSCYSFDGSNDYISIDSTKVRSLITGGSYPFTLALWVYHNDSSRAVLFGDYQMSGSIGFNIELKTSHQLRFYWNGAPDWTCSADIGLQTWTHVAITYDGIGIKVYFNGTCVGTRTGTLSTKTKSSGLYYLGRDNRTGTTAFNGRLNDFRIYDHCLSAAEVKEISQGLVLHYKLSPYNEVTTLSNWLNETGERSVIRSNSANNRIDYMFDTRLRSSSDTSFIAEFDAKGTANNMVIDIYLRASSGLINASSTKTLTTDWEHYILTFTSTTETAQVFSIRLYSGTNGDIAYFKNVKLTSSNMPMNDLKIIDSSGYGHHGTIKNIISYSTDTPKYEKSLYTPRNSAINCGRGGMVTDSITVNLWAKWSTWDHPVSCTEGGGWNFENNPVNFALFLKGNGYITNQNGYAVASSQPSANEWHMLTGVYDRLNHKTLLYIDGELSDEKDTNITNLIGYHGSNVIWLGGEASGSATDFANANYIGNFSDFRIYCTALSAEDIKQLYNTSAKIDKTGKLHTFELIEDEGLKITKNNMVVSSNLIEAEHNFYEGGNVSYKPGNNMFNSYAQYNGVVDLSPIADMGLPITVVYDFDFTWTNFAFVDGANTLLQTQGESRKKEDGTFTWTNRINNTFSLKDYVSESTSGTVHITENVTITAEKFEIFDGTRFGMRCDYSDGNGTLTLSNIKVTLADDKTKFTKSYISASEFIER